MANGKRLYGEAAYNERMKRASTVDSRKLVAFHDVPDEQRLARYEELVRIGAYRPTKPPTRDAAFSPPRKPLGP